MDRMDFHLNGCGYCDHRAIATAWIVIVTTALPVIMSHGEVLYRYEDRTYTACLFLVEKGYNLVAFHVILLIESFNSLKSM